MIRARASKSLAVAGTITRATSYPSDPAREEDKVTQQNIPNTEKPISENQGEGDKASAKRFNEEEQAFVRSGKVEAAAKDAEEALDGPEADELKKAEEKGKRPARS